jgi:hypothetical protein
VGVISGQGAGRRALVLLDPRWLLETRRADDFSNGLEHWSVFSEFGPAKGFWRDRAAGARLIDHPEKAGAKVLNVRRPAGKPAEGAVWNFPAGNKGKLTLLLRLQRGFGGASIALNDRFFNPTDDEGEEKAVCRVPITAGGQLGENLKLEAGRWYTLEITWDLADRKCQVRVDGDEQPSFGQQNAAQNGISYLRIRSTAALTDTAGVLVERVDVETRSDALGVKGAVNPEKTPPR